MNRTELEQRWGMLADEMTRALISVPVMKYTQLAKYLKVDPKIVYRLISRYPERFKEMEYDAVEHQGSLYKIRANGTRNFVRLTAMARNEWGENLGLKPYRVASADVSRIVASADVVVALKRAGLFPHLWEVTLPQETGDSVHLWLTQKVDTTTDWPSAQANDSSQVPLEQTHERAPVGVFMVPHHKDKWAKKNFLIGIVHRVIQHVTVRKVLLLVDAKHYPMALRNLTQTERFDGNTIYLLPLESFCQHPWTFLDAIVSNDRLARENALLFNPPRQRLTVPVGYPYSTLIQDNNGSYRFFDVYGSGQIQKVRVWKTHSRHDAYQIPGEGKLALGSVYVSDDLMYRTIHTILNNSGAYVYPEAEIYRRRD